MNSTAVIAGIGPGFGESLAWNLVKDDYKLAVLSRSSDYLDNFTDELTTAGHEAIGIPTDITQPDQVTRAFNQIQDELGIIDTISIQASEEGGLGTIRELSPQEFKQAWEVYGYGTYLCARAAAEQMLDSGDGGTIMIVGITEGYVTGDAHGFVSANAAKRSLANSLAHELGSDGIHVVHVGIDGIILNPDIREIVTEPVDRDKFIDPDSAAAVCTSLLNQDTGAWTSSVDLRAPISDLDAILDDLRE